MARYLLCIAILSLTNACDYPLQGVPSKKAESLRAEFDTRATRLIENKYLVIPIELQDSDTEKVFGSVMISGSSWSGLGFKGYGPSTRTLNLELVRIG